MTSDRSHTQAFILLYFTSLQWVKSVNKESRSENLPLSGHVLFCVSKNTHWFCCLYYCRWWRYKAGFYSELSKSLINCQVTYYLSFPFSSKCFGQFRTWQIRDHADILYTCTVLFYYFSCHPWVLQIALRSATHERCFSMMLSQIQWGVR